MSDAKPLQIIIILASFFILISLFIYYAFGKILKFVWNHTDVDAR
jgi:hypothetical protein